MPTVDLKTVTSSHQQTVTQPACNAGELPRTVPGFPRVSPEVRGGKVSVKRTEKTGFSRQGENGALRRQRRLPQNNCTLEDQKLAAGCIIIATWQAKCKP
jgi:hypothetical protein